MKKFKFRLEKVLQHRDAIKEEKRGELAKVNAILREQERHLESLSEALLNNSVQESGVVDSSHFLAAGAYSARLRDEIAAQKETIAKTEELVAAARVQYVEAAKDAKALETLKRKRREQYLEYIAKEEEKELDELVIQRTGQRNRQEEGV
ncbi:MAG: flagellar export protein FliJ [Deltaproteobacteria bacterium]|nr:flagellar export protein FliJ [Deltaproteobacteria bacterium]